MSWAEDELTATLPSLDSETQVLVLAVLRELAGLKTDRDLLVARTEAATVYLSKRSWSNGVAPKAMEFLGYHFKGDRVTLVHDRTLRGTMEASRINAEGELRFDVMWDTADDIVMGYAMEQLDKLRDGE